MSEMMGVCHDKFNKEHSLPSSNHFYLTGKYNFITIGWLAQGRKCEPSNDYPFKWAGPENALF